MQLTKYFFKKLHDEMKIINILLNAPKNHIRLDPIDPEDLCVDLNAVQQWSRNNHELLHLILENGMATFICNLDFIYHHYEELIFVNKQIMKIDQSSRKFSKLRILNLSQNKITSIQNLPQNLEQLYLDFNQVSSIQYLKDYHRNLVLLSLSYNQLQDNFIKHITTEFQSLVCLNVASNNIHDIRAFVNHLKNLKNLKILTAYDNPISLLKIYFEYITENVELKVIDGQKYVKPEPPKNQLSKIEQVKQQPKQQKKDPKKDAKKGAKQPQPLKQQKKPEPTVVVETKKELTDEDFTKCKFHLSITNLQNFSGNLYDPSIFPSDYPLEKTQTSYWVSYSFMDYNQELNSKRIKFDQVNLQENQPNRLNFDIQLTFDLFISAETKQKFEKGIIITVHSQQPSIEISQTGEQKPIKLDNEIVMKKVKIGSVFVDVKPMIFKKQKSIQKLYKLWQYQICSRPYFKTPMQGQQKQIQIRKQQFERKLKKEQQQKIKKLQEQETAKNQKKGGKDAKKTEKKPQKKQGKQTATDKKIIQKCNYPLENRQYCYLNENKLYKARNQTLAVKLIIS